MTFEVGVGGNVDCVTGACGPREERRFVVGPARRTRPLKVLDRDVADVRGHPRVGRVHGTDAPARARRLREEARRHRPVPRHVGGARVEIQDHEVVVHEPQGVRAEHHEHRPAVPDAGCVPKNARFDPLVGTRAASRRPAPARPRRSRKASCDRLRSRRRPARHNPQRHRIVGHPVVSATTRCSSRATTWQGVIPHTRYGHVDRTERRRNAQWNGGPSRGSGVRPAVRGERHPEVYPAAARAPISAAASASVRRTRGGSSSCTPPRVGRFTGLRGCTPRRCDGITSRSSIQW